MRLRARSSTSLWPTACACGSRPWCRIALRRRCISAPRATRSAGSTRWSSGSRAGARGYMQVMPFWIKLIGQPKHNLFHLRTNLAYGCAILRHYLDAEEGDYFRALGRYNGSLGQIDYPRQVLAAWKIRWKYTGPTA